MKRLTIIIGYFLAGLVFTFGLSSALPAPGDIQKDISDAIRAGNVTVLARFFNSSIDLSLPGNENTYSKSQAEIIVKDFFTKNPPLSFTVNHTGSSRDGSVYFIGTYVSKVNKSYRTYCLVKKNGDKFLIQQLQFEPE
ncbi:MAG: DUF4783 domain-containing protein [Bacteroidales bacterium]